MAAAKCIWDGKAVLAEGPVWVAAEGALYWVDIKGPAIHRMDFFDGATVSWPMPERVGFILPRKDGNFLIGLKSGLASWSPESGIEKLSVVEPDLPDNRFNDAKVDPKGRLWAGTMDDVEGNATGWLYRFDATDRFRQMDGPYVVTNGPAISPDGRTLYHTDTFRRQTHAFDLGDDGELSNKRLFVELPEGTGFPDGMTVDADGGVWIAHWGGWRVSRFTPDGVFDCKIDLPAGQVTSCVFAGPDLDRMFVTTASIGLDEKALEAQPQAGGLFEVDPGHSGVAMAEAEI